MPTIPTIPHLCIYCATSAPLVKLSGACIIVQSCTTRPSHCTLLGCTNGLFAWCTHRLTTHASSLPAHITMSYGRRRRWIRRWRRRRLSCVHVHALLRCTHVVRRGFYGCLVFVCAPLPLARARQCMRCNLLSSFCVLLADGNVVFTMGVQGGGGGGGSYGGGGGGGRGR